MKYSVFICNPNKNSLSYQHLSNIKRIAERNNVDISVFDVYDNKIKAFIDKSDIENYGSGIVYQDLKDMMEHIRRSQGVVFIFPVWMYGVPAPLKGLLERIIRPEITFKITPDGVEPILYNVKDVFVVCSSGQANHFDRLSQDPVYYTINQMIIDNFSSQCELHYFRIFSVDYVMEHDVKAFIEQVNGAVEHAFSRSESSIPTTY